MAPEVDRQKARRQCAPNAWTASNRDGDRGTGDPDGGGKPRLGLPPHPGYPECPDPARCNRSSRLELPPEEKAAVTGHWPRPRIPRSGAATDLTVDDSSEPSFAVDTLVGDGFGQL